MKYMLFIGSDVNAEPYDAAGDDIVAWLNDVEARGIRLHGDRLRPVEDATTVRVRDGEVLATDGPFTEAKEWVGGYDLIDCADLDEAIEVASKHPMARYGAIEIRPIWSMER
jgi:hypothetical protein